MREVEPRVKSDFEYFVVRVRERLCLFLLQQLVHLSPVHDMGKEVLWVETHHYFGLLGLWA